MQRPSAVHRTDSETSSKPNTLRAAVRESFPRVHSASASPAECALTRSAAPRTTPKNAGWLVPVHCHSESPSVVPLHHNRLQHSRHSSTGKTRVDFQCQTLACVRIHHTEHVDRSSARHRVVRKIQRLGKAPHSLLKCDTQELLLKCHWSEKLGTKAVEGVVTAVVVPLQPVEQLENRVVQLGFQ